jgi:ribosomal-protein-alanine N-acetyltransferase
VTEAVALEPARRSDAGAIARMSAALIETGLGWRWRERAVLHHIADKNSEVVVARAPGARVAGFAIAEFHDRHVHLVLLAVDPAHRRSGIGRLLVCWIEDMAKIAGTFDVILEVRATNAEGRAFYRSLGYVDVGPLPGYYQGIESAWRMRHHLAAGVR